MRLLEKYRAWREERSTRLAAFDHAVARLRETPCETAYRLIEFETCPMMRGALLDLARDVEREEALGRVPPIAASSDPRCRVVLLEPLG